MNSLIRLSRWVPLCIHIHSFLPAHSGTYRDSHCLNATLIFSRPTRLPNLLFHNQVPHILFRPSSRAPSELVVAVFDSSLILQSTIS